MANKSKAQAAKRDPTTLTVQVKPDETQAASLARAALRPSVQGAITVKEYTKGLGDLDLAGLVDELSDQAKTANDGNPKRAEGMLMVQAHTLDAIFNHLARRAINAQYMNQLEPYLRLALKAQSQCRATLETLNTIKNPPQLAWIKQQNVAVNQQVNNGTGDPSRARESEISANELLEVLPHEWLDTRTASTASRINSQLETVEEGRG
jgi:hypothetical protein